MRIGKMNTGTGVASTLVSYTKVVQNIEDLQKIPTPLEGQEVSLSNGGRSGVFVWNFGDYTAQVSADSLGGVFLPKGSDPTGASGCWVRNLEGYVTPEMFGYTAGDVLLYFTEALAFASSDSANNKVVAKNDSYLTSDEVSIPSNVVVDFTGSEIVNTTTGQNGISAKGVAPSVYYPLTTDSVIYSNVVVLDPTDAANFSVGGYILIKDDTIITGCPNTRNITQAQVVRIVSISGGEITLDVCLDYTFKTSSSAEVGSIDHRENITVIGYSFGGIDGLLTGVGADFRYCVGLTLKNTKIFNSRTDYNNSDAFDRLNQNAVNLFSCRDVEIEDLYGEKIGWYVLAIDGCCRNVKGSGIQAKYARHGVSCNWNGGGEPRDIHIENIITDKTTYGGIDTHDVGRYITYKKVRSTSAYYDGGQVRTSDVTVEGYVGVGAGKSGFICYCDDDTASVDLNNVKLYDVTVNGNSKRGVTSLVPISIDGLSAIENGDVYNLTDNGGVSMAGGSLRNSTIKDNKGAAITYFDATSAPSSKGSLLLENITAPYSTDQDTFLYSSETYQDEDVKLTNCTAIGYSTADLFKRGGSTYIADIEDNNCRWSSDPLRGIANLSSGTVTVTNANARAVSSLTGRNWFSRIELTRVEAGTSQGVLTVVISDGTGFTITSSDAGDNGKIMWRFV